jgi:hypothetical protein
MAKKGKKKVQQITHTMTHVVEGKKKRRKRNKAAKLDVAGVAQGTQSQVATRPGGVRRNGKGRRPGCVVHGVELWQTFIREFGAGTEEVHNLVFQPGSSGLPELDQIAGCYELWKAIKVRPFFTTNRPFTEAGKWYMGADFDAEDTITVSRRITQLNPMTDDEVAKNASLPMLNTSQINKGKWMFTPGAGLHPGLDVGFSLACAVDPDHPVGYVAGDVFCEYEIEFSSPFVNVAARAGRAQRSMLHTTAAPGSSTLTRYMDNGNGNHYYNMRLQQGDQISGALNLSWLRSEFDAARKVFTDVWRLTVNNLQDLNYLRNLVVDALYSLTTSTISGGLGTTSTDTVVTITAPSTDSFVEYDGPFNRSGSGSSAECSARSCWLQWTPDALVGNYDLTYTTTYAAPLAASLINFLGSLTLGMAGATRFSSVSPRINVDYDTIRKAETEAMQAERQRTQLLETKLANLHMRLKELEEPDSTNRYVHLSKPGQLEWA